MRSLIRYITRKTRGGIAVREETVEAELLAIGRGNDCAVHLPDPRVLLHHAELAMRSGSWYINALPNADIRINGNVGLSSPIAPGDVVQIGPYEIRFEAPAASPDTGGEPPPDLVVAVELVQPLGDDLNRLLEHSHINVTRIGLSLRTWSWLLAFAALLLLFLVPFWLDLSYSATTARTLTQVHKQPPAEPTRLWTSGAISSSHKFFGVACETCHEVPFVPVRDAACLNCHDGIQRHVERAKYPFAGFTSSTCADCHKEHRGNVSITLNDQSFCVSCHAVLTKKAPQAGLRNVSDFGRNHPQFRPTVMTDTALRTVDRSRLIGDTPPPIENNGLVFPHARHLRASGVRDPVRGMVRLRCEDCHAPTPGGELMRTPTFEGNCHHCHQLKFDKQLPDRELVHDKPEVVLKQLSDIYVAVAVRGGYQEPNAPEIVRRRPGQILSPPEKQIAANWAATKTAAVFNGRFGKGLCGECHVLSKGAPSATVADANAMNLARATPAVATAAVPVATPAVLTWDVKPVEMSARYYPMARFSHARHADVACSTCHDAKHSMYASDVLMPGIGVCQSCHGGEKASNRVPSTCVTCHRFHRNDLTAMHPVTTDSGETSRWDVHQEAIQGANGAK